MRFLFPAAALVLVALVSTPALAEPIIRMESSGAWGVAIEPYSCRMTRALTDGTRKGIFTLETQPIVPTAWLKIAVEGDRRGRDNGDAELIFDGSRLPDPVRYSAYEAGGYDVRSVAADLDVVPFDELKDWLEVRTGDHGQVSVEFEGFADAWAVMRQCRDDLHAKLGVTNDAIERVATPAEGKWIADAGFRRDGRVSTFTIFFWVAEDGRIEGCRLLEPSDEAPADKKACERLERRVKLTPAKDADGNPVRSPEFHQVTIVRR